MSQGAVTCFLGVVALSAVINSPVAANEEFTPERIPGESIANIDSRFLKRFHHLLTDYALREHQCTRPLIMDSRIMRYSRLDKSENPPRLTGPVHEQWKVMACGKKFLFYLGIKPSADGQRGMDVATVSRVVDW